MYTSLFRGLLVAALWPCAGLAQCAVWDPGFVAPGANHAVGTLQLFDDGSGPAVYAGGAFTSVGGIDANYIAKWNGSSWSTLGSGTTSNVFALEVFDNGTGPALYAGGAFLSAGGVTVHNIAKWNGTSWSQLGAGVTGTVRSLEVFDDGSGPALYVGGSFTFAGGITVNHVAKWNGTSWSALGSGATSSSVGALRVFDDGTGPALYAGGGFVIAGNLERVAKWNGTSWSALGSGTNGDVVAFEVFDDGTGPALYAGGYFTSAGGINANRIAKWNGSNWSELDGTTQLGSVFGLHAFDDGSGLALYVGGFFHSVGGGGAESIAKWNGTTWSALGDGVGGSNAGGVGGLLGVVDGTGASLFVSGNFTVAGTVGASNIARWANGSWTALGAGNQMDDVVRALEVYDDGTGVALYAGGEFTAAGNTAAAHVAKWNGSDWSALGTGTSNDVFALRVFDDGSGAALYAGGFFLAAGGTSANRIAKWDGASWSPLGAGVSDLNGCAVNALEVFDDGSGAALYAAGTFTIAGGSSASHIAKWDGSSWSALGTGLTGSQAFANALAVFDDGSGPALFAAGTFTVAGGTSANRIAKWNGSSWSAVGGGMNGYVSSLVACDDGSGPGLFAGGRFSTAGGTSANNIATWNGSMWKALGSGLTGPPDVDVFALGTFDDGSGGALYAGGTFFNAGGAPAAKIAKWNGTTWSPLAGGVAGQFSSPFAIRAFDDGHDADSDLYVGGRFDLVDFHPANCIAEWHGCGATSFCFGDGTGAACPCANDGLPGHGCKNSQTVRGAELTVSGAASLGADSVVLRSEFEVHNALSIFLQGTQAIAPAFFGDGLRCTGGALKRLYSVNANASGIATAPMGAQLSIAARSAQLGDTIAPGTLRQYQVYYRDSNLAFCPDPPGGSFNVSNGIQLLWQP